MMRDLFTIVGDDLSTDSCLAEYLDLEEWSTSHGTLPANCDQPLTSHVGRPVRREEQGWPGDFERAVVTFGRFSRSPFSLDTVKWQESWTFQVGIWVRETVSDDAGQPQPGDLWAADIYDIVVRILAWENSSQSCTENTHVMRREHEGGIVDLTYNENHRCWQIQDRFRWTVVSRGVVAPTGFCCT